MGLNDKIEKEIAVLTNAPQSTKREDDVNFNVAPSRWSTNLFLKKGF